LREGDDPLPPCVEIRVRTDKQPADARFDERGKCGIELRIGAGLGDDDPLADAPRCLLDVLQLALGRRETRPKAGRE
jgi:hypothetical protein